jgi:hypothetical protein
MNERTQDPEAVRAAPRVRVETGRHDDARAAGAPAIARATLSGVGAVPPAEALRLQRAVGNRAAAAILRGGADVVRREVKFARFQGFLSNWGWYNAAEERIRRSLASTAALLGEMAPWTADPRFGRQVTALKTQFEEVDGKTYAESQYAGVEKTLKTLHGALDDVSSAVAARDVRRERSLDAMLAGSFEVVEANAVRARSNQLSRAELADLRALLSDVFDDRASNLRIVAEQGGGGVDLATRAASLGLGAPLELQPLEIEHAKLARRLEGMVERRGDARVEKRRLMGKQNRDAKDDLDLQAAMRTVEELDARIAPVEARLEALKAEHWGYVEEMLRQEVLRDLVRIARTGVGRELLRTVAKESLDREAKKVTINAHGTFRAATAAKNQATGNPYVDYTPQYFRDRDTQQRQQGGAIHTAEALAAHNPWQENARTDITLFHELVHTHHFQSDTAKTDNTLVSADDAVDAVDRPYDSGGPKGVREEEYFTVGLGQYADERLTENTYRAESTALGDAAAKRTYYTHRNARGERIGQE